MRTLIDTHIFIFMLGDPDRLSARQREVVSNPENELLLSLASVWEIAIKYGLGKLQLPAPPETIFPAQTEALGVQLFPISLGHVLNTHQLPQHHHDPFDRLIIAQAMVEQLPVVSSDGRFPHYGIHVI